MLLESTKPAALVPQSELRHCEPSMTTKRPVGGLQSISDTAIICLLKAIGGVDGFELALSLVIMAPPTLRRHLLAFAPKWFVL